MHRDGISQHDYPLSTAISTRRTQAGRPHHSQHSLPALQPRIARSGATETSAAQQAGSIRLFPAPLPDSPHLHRKLELQFLAGVPVPESVTLANSIAAFSATFDDRVRSITASRISPTRFISIRQSSAHVANTQRM